MNVDTICSDIPASSSVHDVLVIVDTNDKLVIVKNPTLAKAPKKSNYEPTIQEASGTVDADTISDATSFLETFFKSYPNASEKKLAYYVQGNILKLINPVFTQDSENVKVKVSVKYIDNQTKVVQISQFEFVLEKLENWMIIEASKVINLK